MATTPANAEMLDLSQHGPLQWHGKLIAINGINYVVDRLIAQGRDGFVHVLRNPRSNLTHHAVKIYRRQERAEEFTDRSVGASAMMNSVPQTGLRAPFHRKVAVLGGVIQFMEYIGPYDDGGPHLTELTHATQIIQRLASKQRECGELGLQQRADLREAVDLLENVLARHPNHVVAMNHLAIALHLEDRNVTAVRLISAAIAVEPNVPKLHYSRLEICASTGLPGQCFGYYRAFKQVFPDVYDMDELGLEVAADCGGVDWMISIQGNLRAGVQHSLRSGLEQYRRTQEFQKDLVQPARELALKLEYAQSLEILHVVSSRYGETAELLLNRGLVQLQLEVYESAAEDLLTASRRLAPVPALAAVRHAAIALLKLDRLERVRQVLDLPMVGSAGLEIEASAVIEMQDRLATWIGDGQVLAERAMLPRSTRLLSLKFTDRSILAFWS